jgi:hypothetical protein
LLKGASGSQSNLQLVISESAVAETVKPPEAAANFLDPRVLKSLF